MLIKTILYGHDLGLTSKPGFQGYNLFKKAKPQEIASPLTFLYFLYNFVFTFSLTRSGKLRSGVTFSSMNEVATFGFFPLN